MMTSLRMIEIPMVMRSGGMCPTVRIGRKASFSVRTPSTQPAAIARTSATGQGSPQTVMTK